MNWIIKVDQLSKAYRLGAGASQHGTLYEQLAKKVRNYFPSSKEEVGENLCQKEEGNTVISSAQSEGLPPGYFWALKDISFEVKPGDRIGVIGKNGSGKSTLLKILSRITTQSHGQFRYKGHLISLLEVGTGFHPELTGRENVYLNAAINGMTSKQVKKRFDQIVDFSEIGSQIDTPVKRYSSGMYTRLAFSVAAFLESEILLIDEVLAVGDQAFQKKCKEKMLEVANDGRSVIFVSHDMNAIESICKKTIELSYGKILEIKDIKPKDRLDELESKELQHSKTEQKSVELVATHSYDSKLLSLMKKEEVISTYLKMISFRTCNAKGATQDTYSVNDAIKIEVQFEVINPKLRLNVQVNLSTRENTLLLSSMDHHCFNSQNALREPGIYTEVVTIPAQYLNVGVFMISISMIDLETPEDSLYCSDSLTFSIIDQGQPIGVRANWVDTWPEALLRPNLNWDVKYKAHNLITLNAEEAAENIEDTADLEVTI